MNSGHIKVKVGFQFKKVFVVDTENCKSYDCFHPHDCPVQGARGVRSSAARWMCLTNVNRGCPDKPKLKK